MTATKMGVVQMRIMNVLWALGRASARQITEELNKNEPIAHSTVQTLLRGLMDKGAVTYETEGRTFVFKPAVAADKVRKSATRDLLQRVFDGSARELVSHLLKNEKLSPQELDEIKKLVNEKAKKK